MFLLILKGYERDYKKILPVLVKEREVGVYYIRQEQLSVICVLLCSSEFVFYNFIFAMFGSRHLRISFASLQTIFLSGPLKGLIIFLLTFCYIILSRYKYSSICSTRFYVFNKVKHYFARFEINHFGFWR